MDKITDKVAQVLGDQSEIIDMLRHEKSTIVPIRRTYALNLHLEIDRLRAENARLAAAHEAAADELARVVQELREAISGRKDAISEAIMDWNLSSPPFPFLNEYTIVDLITAATTALDYAYKNTRQP